ncbi:MAG TPA: hypothetical protein VGH19_22015 [Verrucomicrobiae bacterium]
MLTKTTRCGEFGHKEFLIECDDVLVQAGTTRWFIDWLESSVQAGKVFAPGQHVQLGWSILKVMPEVDNYLSFSEPDFSSSPIQFVPGVSQSLQHLFIQKSIAESIGVKEELTIPSLQTSAIICSRFSIEKPLFFSRSEPVEKDSGWFFGCLDQTHNHSVVEELRKVSLYEAALRHGFRMVPYLGLPAGTDVILVGKEIEIYRDRKPMALQPGSYLAELLQKR